MHIKQLLTTMLSAVALCSPPAISATPDAPIKSEFRSVWLSTVWQLDFPSTKITTTGSTTQINKQKEQMSALLDSLAANNFNAVCFQVRGRADAFYKSSYEPWSSDLVSTRGMDPGWDPLEWTVAEAHKRGIECHAWVNPFRYESVANAWDGLPGCYRTDHPDWILDISTTSNGTTTTGSIFNPGKAEVREHLVKILREIVTNYDIDGLMFDDYFYKQGTYENGGDDAQYQAYKDATTNPMSLGDWRRENINQFVADVYNMVQDVKPWVRFGIGPPGVAASAQSVADKYGVTPSPGSDWQYNGQYSDVLAWISRQIIDYVTPQIYWTIGHTTDYSALVPWWSMIADKFGRHFYSSNSITSLTASSKAPAITPIGRDESDEVSPLASGPNNTTFAEYANEIRLNRTSTIDGNPGVILFRAKYVCTNSVSKNFGHYLHNTVFGYKSLIPAMGHKPKVDPGTVSNLSLNGNTLSWDPVDNARVTIYAIPSDISVESFDRQADYLLGVSYDSSYTIPSTLLSNHYFAVCIYDRYGYEYSPAFSATPSGINSISLNNGVRIAGSELIVDLPEGYITVTATAIDGRLIGDIYSGQSNGATAIPLSSLGHGAYIISVKSASGLQSLKVIL